MIRRKDYGVRALKIAHNELYTATKLPHTPYSFDTSITKAPTIQSNDSKGGRGHHSGTG